MSTTPLTRLDLTLLEYDNLNAELSSLIATRTPFWNNPSSSDPLIILINQVSALGDMFHFFIEQRTNEMILTRSQRKKSVIDLGKVFDYHLTRPFTTVYSLNVRAKASRSPTTSATQTFPVGTKFNSNQKSFILKQELTADFTSYPPPSEKEGKEGVLKVYEGVFYQETFSLSPLATDQKIYEIPLTYSNISQNFLIVKVNGVEWQEEDFSPSIEFNTQKYIIETDEQGFSTLVFNGFKYDLPQDVNSSSSSKVEVSYVSTTGVEGIITNASEINTFDLPYDVPVNFSSDFEIDSVNITLKDPYIPEADWKQAKYKVSSSLSTLWRAVSLNDYEKLTLTLPKISSVKAIRKDDNLNRHIAQVYINSEGGQLEAYNMKDDVQQFLLDRSCVGVGVEVLPSSPRDFYLTVEANYLSRYTISQIQLSLTQKAIEISNSLGVGETLTVDRVYETLSLVEGIVSLKINTMSFVKDSNTVSHLQPLPQETLTLKNSNVRILPVFIKTAV